MISQKSKVLRPKAQTGFTLIELMIVVGIMGVMMLISVPIVYRVWHKEAMRQAISDITEMCNKARAQAILQDKMVDVVFHPRDRQLSVSGGGGGKNAEATINPEFSTTTVSGAGQSAQLSERITIELLDINMAGVAYESEDVAVVHFYPDGTCDEMRMVLLDNDDAERRGIEVEPSTGIVNMVPDIREWRNR